MTRFEVSPYMLARDGSTDDMPSFIRIQSVILILPKQKHLTDHFAPLYVTGELIVLFHQSTDTSRQIMETKMSSNGVMCADP